MPICPEATFAECASLVRTLLEPSSSVRICHIRRCSLRLDPRRTDVDGGRPGWVAVMLMSPPLRKRNPPCS
jgi:hypothetical protein